MTGFPYIPNSAPGVRAAMLAEIGLLDDAAALHSAIPDHLRTPLPDGYPPRLTSEQDLRAHVEELLDRNVSTAEVVSFLGGGCADHYVPAVCDEIIQRSEFLTSYFASAYTDHGKFQAFFEYQSLLGELIDRDVVPLPTYDWGTAAGIALKMAGRMTGRSVVLVSAAVESERLSVIRGYCTDLTVREVPYELATGTVDLAACLEMLDSKVAALYVEQPSGFGTVDAGLEDLGEAVHRCGGEYVVGVDPISLGVLSPPSAYGADMVCGDLQSLGLHMNCGGGIAGFLGLPNKLRYVEQCPGLIVGLTSTVTGQHAFGHIYQARTTYRDRRHGKDFVGTAAGLWAIAAAVFLAAVGPKGLMDIGKTILSRTAYARLRLRDVDGVRLPFAGVSFKELVVTLPANRTVMEHNRVLLSHGILGGHPLGDRQPALRNAALYCVSEKRSTGEIDRLSEVLQVSGHA